jgi:hypothetical protein
MNNADSEGEFEDRWEVAWTEFDWERYVRQQDDSIRRYLAYYDDARDNPDRIDEAARQMGWDMEVDEDDEDAEEINTPIPEVPYTLHKHPVYVASKALYISLQRQWERICLDFHGQVPPAVQVGLLSSLHRGDLDATMAIQSLDVGDYSLAVSQFKRALSDVNESLRHVECLESSKSKTIQAFVADARMRLFDLREIWLRVMSDCRNEDLRGFEEDSDN